MTRDEAKQAGLSRFWGDPCPKKHNSPRYVSTGACLACQKLQNSETARRRAEAATVCSKAEAIERGLKTYRDTKPCRNGHDGVRYLSTGICVTCQAESKARTRVVFRVVGSKAEIAVLAEIWGALLQARKVEK